jgi:hypothetical protein
MANVLVTESAAIQATFIQFHNKIAGSLDRLTEFLVKEQAEVQEDRHTVLGLLQRLVWAAEGAPARQVEAIPAAVAENTEAGPLVAGGDMETVASEMVVGPAGRAWTPLFLLSDENTEPSDESFVSGVESSSSEGDSEDKGEDNIETLIRPCGLEGGPEGVPR